MSRGNALEHSGEEISDGEGESAPVDKDVDPGLGRKLIDANHEKREWVANRIKTYNLVGPRSTKLALKVDWST